MFPFSNSKLMCKVGEVQAPDRAGYPKLALSQDDAGMLFLSSILVHLLDICTAATVGEQL